MRQSPRGRLTLGVLMAIALAVLIGFSELPRQLVHDLGAFMRLPLTSVGLLVALSCLSMLISGAMWSRLLALLAYRIPARAGFQAFLAAGLAGHLVNTAGSALGTAVCLKRHGVCASSALLLSLIADALGFWGLLVWTPLGLLLLSRGGIDTGLPLIGRHGPLVAALALAILMVAMFEILRALAAAGRSGSQLARKVLGVLPGRRFGAFNAPPAPTLRLRRLLALVPWSAMAWFAGTLSFYVLLEALNPGKSVSATDVIGAYAIATALGALAFFVPDGMGVRDGILVALLAKSTGLPLASCAATAVASRALDPVLKLAMLLVVSALPTWTPDNGARMANRISPRLVLLIQNIRFLAGRAALPLSRDTE